MKRIFLCMFIFLSLLSVGIYPETYNPGDTVSLDLTVDPGVTLTGDIATAYIMYGTTEITTETMSPQVAFGNLWYHGSYTTEPDASEGDYTVIIKWIYNGDTYYGSTNYTIAAPTDSTAGYGYLTHLDTDGSPVVIPGGAPAYNADVVVYFSSSSIKVGRAAVDVNGEFKIWVPGGRTYDIEIKFPGYNPVTYRNKTPTLP